MIASNSQRGSSDSAKLQAYEKSPCDPLLALLHSGQFAVPYTKATNLCQPVEFAQSEKTKLL